MNVGRGALYCCTLALPGHAAAHGFGARYDLPIPLSLYITGAGLVVALSFVMLGSVLRLAPVSAGALRADGGRWPLVLPIARVIGVAVYLSVVFAGLFGVQSPLKNIAPVFVWALWWVGMSYVSAFIGNLWVLVNPLDGLFAWVDAFYARLRRGRPLEKHLHYPERLGVWPAVLLFLVFLWMEIVWEASDRPASLAVAMLGYSAFTWLGMAAFGRRKWLQRGEVFSLIFGLLARLAPVHLSVDRERVAVELRPYALGLLVREPVDRSYVALVLLLLAAVSFDGFIETPAWAALAELTGDGILLKSLGLFLAPCLFLGIFLLVCRLSAWSAQTALRSPGERKSTWRLAGLFANTLVPIAIAYHLAHYLSFLAMAAQYLVPLASDPMGLGWDLFGTVNHFVRPGWVDARVVWNVSVGAIVVGHVAAVYLAHLQALQEFADRRAALRSQYPMLGLMVGYTMLSLWIIAQPNVSSRFS
ncbi:MAG: hypothetical protein M3023_04625 [Pseudomonadota bacterium]|nr:hypothetical protein [Pseudomonadota bacterium]